MLSMLETVEIAMLGTLLAIILSIPIALLSARNLSPNYPIYLVAKTITIFFRAIPEFIMAMILVIAIGFGAMPGIIALGFHTMGFLAKFMQSLLSMSMKVQFRPLNQWVHLSGR